VIFLPTYGYQCNDCKHEFSVFQAMKDDPIAICPQCTGGVKRLLYPVGIVFKGSGWYINDSRKPEKAEGNGEKADASKTDGSPDTAKSDNTKSDSAKSETTKSETSSDKSSDKSKPAPATASASSEK
jgi:putative FmdB family regulatory protein